MKLFKKAKAYLQSKFSRAVNHDAEALAMRLDRLERNYIILLKRVLELDGIQLKLSAFSSKVLQTNSDESEPTLH